MVASDAEFQIVGERPEFDVVRNEQPVREAARRILEHARYGGSVFVDRDVWTRENLDALVEFFVKQPDVSGGSFFEKLDTQLADTPHDARVLFAEIFLLQMLPTVQFKRETKEEHLRRVLGSDSESFELPGYVAEAFDSPVFNGGMGFAIRRFHQLTVLIEFFRYLHTLSPEERDEAYADPRAWQRIVQESPGTPEPSIRASLMYLGHPDYFFPIVSQQHKQEIVAGFFPAVTKRLPSKNTEADLYALRTWLAAEPGTTPNFYEPELSGFWRDEAGVTAEEEAEVTPANGGDDTYTIDSILAEGAFHERAQLRAIVERWQETRNVVLQGAPGTGKTWLARRLAFALIGQRVEEAVRAVQFHPGTSYEDFVRGWRPGGDGRLTLVDGPLLQHAERARKNPDIPHVIIIEEFNRGNPAQAFGEMLTLLERSKRSEADALELTYMREGETSFFLPDNLFVIGTMNTADRSLALVDFALRRRFAFFELSPQLGPAWREHMARQFRSEPAGRIAEIARRVEALNVEIAEDQSLGRSFMLGHSYFTPGQEATDVVAWFRSVVESSVKPQLTEYWFGDEDRVGHATARLLADF